ncbi:transcriptional regulator, ArsR family [Cognatiyoonia koreensis]|uniref:Transcriptional regulator, ArsR family n=1 Tax=Cognatiyoonia koreensis TaxID=364200 RepID=A0A1I0Q115_9RHOB|nr:metalloregulator ArsR/SmtB family transcription factor [Cognatiyoonia koreensis]SEW20475.1 transcriptional regulator, ArsR family [Cognatiyoonia koreensis]
MTYEHAIAALADPSRRTIVEVLRNGPLPVVQIASGLPISRPAVSQHLKVLSDAGLLEVKVMGNRRIYQLAPTGIDHLRAYLDSLWDDALAALKREAEAIAQQQKGNE